MSNVTSSSPGTARCLAVGALVSLIAACVWAFIVEITHYKVGIVATGIGILVGLAMARTASTDRRLPVIGAALALAGCLVGDFLADSSAAAQEVGTSFLNVVTKSIENPNLAWELFRIGFAPMDFLFWGLAAYAAFRQVQQGVAVATARSAQPAAAAGSGGTTDGQSGIDFGASGAPSATPVEGAPAEVVAAPQVSADTTPSASADGAPTDSAPGAGVPAAHPAAD
ncbi:MAG TPA: hypothetical protein VFP72_10195 [Kineosporiaceae bacterium]|nr:hypothetical protein [Kineosporiaceae bacterium]